MRMGYGTATIVDLSTGLVTSLKIPKRFVELYGGGRGFNSRILFEFRKVNKDVEDVVIISPGLLTGSKFPSTSRVTISVLNSAVSKRFSDSSLGGFFASYFKLAGCSCLIIKGHASSSKVIELDAGEVRIVDAPFHWEGMGIPYINNEIRNEYNADGKRWKGLINGISGENGVWCSGLFSDKRLAAAAGAGKAFGNMNLKAIVVPERPHHFVQSMDSALDPRFDKSVENAIDHIKGHPVYKMFSKFGTTSLVEIHSALKYFPSYNFNDNQFEGWKKISGKANFSEGLGWRKNREELNEQGLLNCRECPIQCSAPKRMEYEGLQGLGAKIGSDDLKFIQRMNAWFEDVGADLIQPTGVLSAIMDMWNDKVIVFNGPGLAQVDLSWGNTEFAEEFLRGLMYQKSDKPAGSIGVCFKDGFNEGLEKLISSGYAELAEGWDIKKANFEYFVAIKNMALSGVMPSKGHKGVAVAIATSTRGACHLRSLPTLASYAGWYLKSMKFRRILDMFKISFSAMSIMKSERSNLIKSLYPNYVRRFGVPKFVADEWEREGFLFAEEDDYKGHARMIWFTQAEYAAADCFGQCRFTSCWRFGLGPLIVSEAGKNLTGLPYDEYKFMEMGERVYAIERMLLFMYGDKPADDRLPAKFFGKEWSITPEGFEQMMVEYYDRCGYDNIGKPTEATMAKLVYDAEYEFTEVKSFLGELTK